MASPHDLGPADVAVVVPIGGQAPSWGRCARSLARLDPGPAEIVVVIDGPNDTASSLAAGIGATVVQLEKRSGPAKARNLGAQTTEADLLLFIDSDIEVPKILSPPSPQFFPLNRKPRLLSVHTMNRRAIRRSSPSTGTCCTISSTRKAWREPPPSGRDAGPFADGPLKR